MKKQIASKEKIVRRTARSLKQVPSRYFLDAFLWKGVWVGYEVKKGRCSK